MPTYVVQPDGTYRVIMDSPNTSMPPQAAPQFGAPYAQNAMAPGQGMWQTPQSAPMHARTFVPQINMAPQHNMAPQFPSTAPQSTFVAQPVVAPNTWNTHTVGRPTGTSHTTFGAPQQAFSGPGAPSAGWQWQPRSNDIHMDTHRWKGQHNEYAFIPPTLGPAAIARQRALLAEARAPLRSSNAAGWDDSNIPPGRDISLFDWPNNMPILDWSDLVPRPPPPPSSGPR